MEKAGINDTLIAKKLRDGLDAMAPPRKDGGKQYEDQFVRKQFLDVIFKVRGDYAPERTENIEKNIVIVMDGRMIEALRDSKALPIEEADVLDAEIVSDSREDEITDGELRADNADQGILEDSPGPTEAVEVDRPLPERSLLSMPGGAPDA
jgi:hypothetical protein